jgi:Domain of unknown function (DUF4349)
MRRREPLDPAVARDLAALDAALAGAPADHVDAELAALVRDVGAAAPRLDGPARAALDARVADGFAPDRPPRRRPLRPGRLRLPRRALGAGVAGAIAAAVAFVVAVGGLGGDRTGSGAPASGVLSAPVPGVGPAAGAGGAGANGGGGAGGAGATAPGSAPQPALAPSPPAVTPVPPTGAASPAPGRRVERSVRLALRTGTDRFEAVTDGVVRTTQDAGGFVAGSQVRRTGTRGTATFVLRIPAARLGAALAGLSRLAHVRSIEQASEDLTGAHDATAARLQDARTRRRALVAALATASGERAAGLRSRLTAARARERGLERALRALRSRTAYATVDVTVTAVRRPAAASTSSGARFTPAAAWRDARRGLEIAAGVAIIGLALGLPLALAGALAAGAVGVVRRRRREGALDAA